MMFNTNNPRNEELDRAGRLVLKAAAASEVDTEAAAASPFLFTRISAAIAEEQRRREAAGNWLSLIFVARRAVPALALVTLLVAALTFWTAFTAPATPNNFDEEALFEAPAAGVEQTVLAGSTLTQDDIVNIVVDREYGRNGR